MTGFGKVFSSIFDSTLATEGGWLPTYVMMSMVALADAHGYVRMAPKALFRRMGFREYDSRISYDDFEAALQFLEAPDPDSQSPAYEGRRIIPLTQLPDIEGARGWWLVNHQLYRGKRDDDARREYQRKWVAEKRARSRQEGRHESTVDTRLPQSTQAEAEAEAEAVPPPSGERSRKRSPARKGSRWNADYTLPPVWYDWAMENSPLNNQQVHDQYERFRDYWVAQPGQKGVKLDWLATWRNWIRRAAEFSPAPSTGTPRWSEYPSDTVLTVAQLLGVGTRGKDNRQLFPELSQAYRQADTTVQLNVMEALR